MFQGRNILIGIIVASAMVLSACGGDNSSGTTDKKEVDSDKTITTSLKGVAQKGPFKEGSEITLCKIDDKLLCTDDTINTKVTDDAGSYALGSISWSGLSKLTISGYYLDEVTGLTSTSSIEISAIIELKPKEENNKNVNILTHLRLLRTKELLAAGKSFDEAYQDAQQDIKDIFNVQSDDFTALDLTDFTSGKASVNAELLRISAAINNSNDPVADLGDLLELYDDGGLPAVLASSLYMELMSYLEAVNFDEVLSTLDVDVSLIDLGALDIPAYAMAVMHIEGAAYSNNKVAIRLISTSFNTSSPNITVSSTGEVMNIVNIEVSDDNKSAVLEMDGYVSCSSQSLTFTIDNLDLEGRVAAPLQTNTVPYVTPNLTCADDGGDIITVPITINHNPLVSISPSTDVEITAGETVTLKSRASDEDGDNIIIAWKLKESAASEYLDIPNFGSTGFTYTFNDAGVYLVVVEADDGEGGIASANITVTVNAKPSVEMTLPDINISIAVKGFDTISTGEAHTTQMSLHEQPSHGAAEAYLIGGEYWSLIYTSTDCFIGQDSFIYNIGSDYGRVIVDISSPSTLKASNVARSLLYTDTISDEYLTVNDVASISTPTLSGTSSVSVIGSDSVHYSYAPNDGFVGSDFFDYTVSEVINECTYTATGRVDFTVKAPVHLFVWDDNTGYGGELWKTDGEVEGTSMVIDLNPGDDSGVYDTGVKIGDINYFRGSDALNSSELFKTDGTAEGTMLVKDVNTSEGKGSYLANLTLIGETFYFFAMSGDFDYSYQGEKQLWQSDGTEAGTKLIENFGNFSETSYVEPGYLHAFGDLLIFSMDDSAGYGSDSEPWVYDTTTISLSSKLKDIWPGSGGSSFECEVILNNLCYGQADDYSHGGELWVSDGTTEGTTMITDLYPGADSYNRGYGSVLGNLKLSGSRFFFTAFTPEYGVALWKSDGTEAGTQMVKDHYPDDNTTYSIRDKYDNYTDVNGTFYFTFWDDNYGSEIWTSDGTEGGTIMLKDVGTGKPTTLIAVNDIIYFWYIDENQDNSGLWKTDGTEAGTVQVKQFSYYDVELSRSYLTTEHGLLYIEIINYLNNYRRELWRSDGTEAGTFKLVEGESMME